MRLPVSELVASRRAIARIVDLEDFRAKAYLDDRGRGKVWTIGFGATERVTEGQTITVREAFRRLIQSVAEVEADLVRLVSVPLEPYEFDALVCFVYNVGAPAFASSTMRKKVNSGDYAGTAAEFARWTFAGGKKLNGLVKRREIEASMFRGERLS